MLNLKRKNGSKSFGLQRFNYPENHMNELSRYLVK